MRNSNPSALRIPRKWRVQIIADPPSAAKGGPLDATLLDAIHGQIIAGMADSADPFRPHVAAVAVAVAPSMRGALWKLSHPEAAQLVCLAVIHPERPPETAEAVPVPGSDGTGDLAEAVPVPGSEELPAEGAP